MSDHDSGITIRLDRGSDGREARMSANGITVTAEITDWGALGRHVADMGSIGQAKFLAGFADALIGPHAKFNGRLQMGWVARDLVRAGEGSTVREALRYLADSIDEEQPDV